MEDRGLHPRRAEIERLAKNIEGINVHKYGPHIFHTDNKEVWNFIRQFAEFNHFIYSPIANYKGELYNLPFNMNTFHQLWGVKTPEEAKKTMDALKLMGEDLELEPENPS